MLQSNACICVRVPGLKRVSQGHTRSGSFIEQIDSVHTHMLIFYYTQSPHYPLFWTLSARCHPLQSGARACANRA